jgi:hypothetical protein
MEGEDTKELMSFCRQCGGERYHSVFARKTRTWQDDNVDGRDTWSIVECRGCQAVTFVHAHWMSEELEMTENGPALVIHRSLYPPAPTRKMPEWSTDILLNIGWVSELLNGIYAATGMQHYALAAMGLRSIVDFVVTAQAGDDNIGFLKKLNRLRDKRMITQTQVDVLYAAFDAGSATAHRGFSPTQEDVYTLLGITESLIEQVYINPARQKRQAEAAAALEARTPKRRS